MMVCGMVGRVLGAGWYGWNEGDSPKQRGRAREGRPAPEPSFAQRDRASGGRAEFSYISKEGAITVNLVQS